MKRRLVLLAPMAAALVAAGCASLPTQGVAAGHWDAFNRSQIDGNSRSKK